MQQEKTAVTIGIMGEESTVGEYLSVVHKFAIRAGLIDASDAATPTNVGFHGQDEVQVFKFESDFRRYHVIYDRINIGIITRMTSHATPLDGAILVINLSGSLDQALTYIGYARQLLIPALIVVLNYAGGISESRESSAIRMRVIEELEKHFYPIDGTPIISLKIDKYSTDLIEKKAIKSFYRLVRSMDKFIPSPEQPSGAPLLPGIAEHYMIHKYGHTIDMDVIPSNQLHVASIEEQARDTAGAPVLRAIDFEVGRGSDQNVGFFFATTRAPSNDVDHLGYSGERSDDLRFGRALVRVPDKRSPGSLDLPRMGWKVSLLGKQIRLFKQKCNPKKHFLIKDIEEMEQEEWLSDVKSQDKRQALVFVHGFNNSFADSVYRAAQIFWDLRFTGLPVLFSWASRGYVRSYFYDQQSALHGRQNFLSMLSMLADQGIQEVFILAHSMGSFLVTEALNAANEAQVGLIQELVMAAADVDKNNFRTFCQKRGDLHGKMTLYASATDRALLASMELADRIPRAGFVPKEGPIVLPGLDTIDGTPLGHQIFGLNHSDYAEEASLLNDLGILISQRTRPPTSRLVSYQEQSRVEDDMTLKWWLYPAR